MEPPSSSRVSVLNESGIAVPVSLIQRAATAAFADGDVCVLLTSDDEVHRLNKLFRNVDAPTDVLTFPSGEDEPGGDVAIAVPYAQRQADLRGVTLEQELAYLAIHGALHLAGMDDEEEEDRSQMVAEMNKVARSIGLAEDNDWSSLLHGDAS